MLALLLKIEEESGGGDEEPVGTETDAEIESGESTGGV